MYCCKIKFYEKLLTLNKNKRLSNVHKRRPQTSGVLQKRTSALFGAKTFGFFEIYSVSALTRGGWTQCWYRWRGINFVRTAFMDDP